MNKIIKCAVIIAILTNIFSCSLLSRDTGKFKTVDGKELFFNGEEQIVDRLVTYNGEQYYIKEDGTKAKNEWKVIDNGNKEWAYFGAKGIMVKNQIWTIGGNYFIFDENGKMANSGLIDFDSDKYYATKDGYLLKKQFKIIEGIDYYFNDEGKKLNISTPSWVENININGLGDLKTGWYYLDEKGQRIKNQWIDNYYLNEEGLMLVDTWIGSGDSSVYVGADGKKQTTYKEVINTLKDIFGTSNTNSNNNSSNNNSSYGIWQIKYYVDEYGDYTNDRYISANLEGQMSNSVSNNIKSDFVFLIGDNYVDLKIYEYGTMEVTNLSRLRSYYVSIKDANGNINNFRGNMYNDRIEFDSECSEYIINNLKGNQSFKLLIEEDTSYNEYLKPTKYVVEVRPDNFASLYWN